MERKKSVLAKRRAKKLIDNLGAMYDLRIFSPARRNFLRNLAYKGSIGGKEARVLQKQHKEWVKKHGRTGAGLYIACIESAKSRWPHHVDYSREKRARIPVY
ncbi:MAG: hypothetical protein ACE5DI_06170 [Candidatus Micrarchaeia archaeon]